ncbi:hypothetical protein THRCLA_04177 [Thraustotheca clavata]|uniref:Uncharacterized protein n=1 Tax=Thraustotheca clavata TaxID=74557 RepID=A0A1V9ZZS6_9STRA|nr:hypothetical protein THRCLA_04177 [Thraustotheca clavata]
MLESRRRIWTWSRRIVRNTMENLREKMFVDEKKENVVEKKLERTERLQDMLWKPALEFQSSAIEREKRSLSHTLQVAERLTIGTVVSVLQPAPLIVLGSCCSIVLAIGGIEGAYLLKPEYYAQMGLPDNYSMTFIVEYAYENFASSCIWDTRPPNLVARALDLNPDEILHVFTDTPEDAQLMLTILGLRTKRALVAGFMLVAQWLSIMSSAMKVSRVYKENVLTGKEPPLHGIQERILRLTGTASDASEVSMARYGAHILPVFKDPEKMGYLIDVWSMRGKVPVVWHVPSGKYGFRHSWTGLRIDRRYMLRTTTGKLILTMEADLTLSEEGFHLMTNLQHDLSIEEASQGFRLIERAASARIERPFRTLRVMLGDTDQVDNQVKLRTRLDAKQECDVFIDAKAIVMLAILKWASRFPESTTIVIDSTPEHYAYFSHLLASKGLKTITQQEAAITKDTDKWPHLVYLSTTAATINALQTLLQSGQADPSKCCVLLNNAYGLEHLREISSYEDERIGSICAAELHDDYYRQVRIWTRMGYSAKSIQTELDVRFAEVLKLKSSTPPLKQSITT